MLQVIPPDAEITAVTTIPAVHQVPPAPLNDPTAQRDKPNIGPAHSQDEPFEPLRCPNMRCFQVKAMSFEVAVERLGPGTDPVAPQRSRTHRLTSGQVPGFVFSLGPMHHHLRLEAMLLGQLDRSNVASLSLKQGAV